MFDGFAETWLNIFVCVLSWFSSYSNCRITPLLPYILSCCYFRSEKKSMRMMRLGEWFIRSRWVQVSTGIATKAKSTCQIIHFFQRIHLRLIRPAAKSNYVTRIFFFNSHFFPPFRANRRWIIADFHLYPCDVSHLLNLLSSAMKRFTNWFRNSFEQHD